MEDENEVQRVKNALMIKGIFCTSAYHSFESLKQFTTLFSIFHSIAHDNRRLFLIITFIWKQNDNILY